MSDNTPTHDLVNSWMHARQSAQYWKRGLGEAEKSKREVENVLGRRLDPGDMAVGEEIAIWVRLNRKQERLVVVCKTTVEVGDSPATYKLSFRGSPRGEEPEDGQG